MLQEITSYIFLNKFDTIISYLSNNKTSYFYSLEHFISPMIIDPNRSTSFIFVFKTMVYFIISYIFYKLSILNFRSGLSTTADVCKRFKFLTFVGLGFKKRMVRKGRHIYLFFGHRHWITFAIPDKFSIYLIKRKSIILLSDVKHAVNTFMSSFKDFKKESMFKLKGLFDMRSRRRWLFMRRIKVRGVKPKLSKKQKLL